MLKFGIIGAMDVEVENLKNLMDNIVVTEKGSLKFYEGQINGKSVVVVQSGIGKVNAALCAQLLIIVFNVTHIINTGIAGAISDKLRILDIVISSDCIYHDVDTTFFGDPDCTLPDMPTKFIADSKLITIAQKAFKECKCNYNLHSGTITSGDRFIHSQEEKDIIKAKTNAMCVEMEGVAIAHACYLYNIPFLIIRTISDLANNLVVLDYAFNKSKAAEVSSNLVYNIINEFGE